MRGGGGGDVSVGDLYIVLGTMALAHHPAVLQAQKILNTNIVNNSLMVRLQNSVLPFSAVCRILFFLYTDFNYSMTCAGDYQG